MKSALSLSILAFIGSGLLCSNVRAQSVVVQGRSTYHDDDSAHTETIRDTANRLLTEMSYQRSYGAQDVLISKTTFQLNDSGLPTQGVVLDGAENFVGRVQFFYDDLGRAIEKRLFNSAGQVYQRIIQQYDSAGQPLKPLLYNYDVRRPVMRTKTIDMTQGQTPPQSTSSSSKRPPPVQRSSRTVPQAAVPRAQIVAPAAPQGSGAPSANGTRPLEIMTVSPQTGAASVSP